MDIQISFQKKKFNKATEEFLCSKMDEEQDAELITNLKSFASGEVKKSNAKIANALLIRIIKAIIIKDDLEETLNSTFNDNEHADDEDESDGDSDDEEDDEKPINENDATIIEIKNVDPGQGNERLFLGVLKEDLFYFSLNDFSEIITFRYTSYSIELLLANDTFGACPIQFCRAILLVSLVCSFLYASNHIFHLINLSTYHDVLLLKASLCIYQSYLTRFCCKETNLNCSIA